MNGCQEFPMSEDVPIVSPIILIDPKKYPKRRNRTEHYRDWYAKNKERCKEYKRQWEIKNKERCSERHRQWYIENKKIHLENSKQRYIQNKKECLKW